MGGRRPPFLSGRGDDTDEGDLATLMSKAWAQDTGARPSFGQIEEDLIRVFRRVKGGAVGRFRALSGVEVSAIDSCCVCVAAFRPYVQDVWFAPGPFYGGRLPGASIRINQRVVMGKVR